MEFQRKGNTIVLKTNTITAEITADSEGYFTVGGSLAFPIEKSGEYEFGSITFVALEQPVDGAAFTGKPNVLNINELTYGAVIMMSNFELTKETINSIAHAQILITSVFDTKFVKQMQRSLALEKVLMVRTVGQNINEEETANLKKQLEVTDIIESNKVKFSDKDFNSEEDKIFDAYLLS